MISNVAFFSSICNLHHPPPYSYKYVSFKTKRKGRTGRISAPSLDRGPMFWVPVLPKEKNAAWT